MPDSHCSITGLIAHSNHAAAAVMIVNPTTPNTVAGNMSQQFNVSDFAFILCAYFGFLKC